MSKELKEALVRANRIIDHWEENELESYEAMEMIAPLLKTITVHVENVLDPAAGSDEAASFEKKEESEAAIEKEKEELLESKEGDLFSKTEDLEEEKEDESKSKSKKKRKEFAGSNGEIPF